MYVFCEVVMKKRAYEKKLWLKLLISLINPVLITLSVVCIAVATYMLIKLNLEFFEVSRSTLTSARRGLNQVFPQGIIGELYTVAGVLLLVATFHAQFIEKKKSQISEMFLTMLKFHNSNVENLKISDYRNKRDHKDVYGKRAFVVFKLQLFDCINLVKDIGIECKINLSNGDVANIAYLSFFYGIDDLWKDFMKEYLKQYDGIIIDKLLVKKKEIRSRDGKNVGRTNQTSLGPYFRNMYNMIKIIDESIYHSKKEKYQKIKLLRAQLSNSELAVLYFNLMSEFGLKWKKEKIKISKNKIVWIEHNMVTRYKLLKNIPNSYLNNFDRKQSFNMEYEDEELFGTDNGER